MQHRSPVGRRSGVKSVGRVGAGSGAPTALEQGGATEAHEEEFAVGSHQHVIGVEPAMGDARLVQLCHQVAELACEAGHGHPESGNPRQGPPRAHGHHDHEVAGRSRPDVEKARHRTDRVPGENATLLVAGGRCIPSRRRIPSSRRIRSRHRQ
ncbi:hypothetical protein VD659_08620 [Herbiconiux sp. 11R-BC]|uniref:hypothetical protein n=1 Tax=Herbiconiux sp. 11R-BC TaxID=3111637 RepID=UPI003C0D75E7